MKKLKKKSNTNFVLLALGVGLIAFAVIPTPDDVTVISPVLALTTGVALVYNAFK